MIKLVREESSLEPLPGFGLDEGVVSDPVAEAIVFDIFLLPKPGRRRREMDNNKKGKTKK